MKRLMALLALVTLTSPTLAMPTEAEQERLGTGFVRRVAEGDAEALAAYIQETFADSLLERRDAAGWHDLAQQLCRHQGLELAGVFFDEPGRLGIEAESPLGLTLLFSFDFTKEAGDKIASLSVEAGRGGGHGSEGPELPDIDLPDGASREQIASALGRYFDGLAESGLFDGAALVAWHGEPLYRGAWGLASREWKAPNTLETRFDLGSINKSFTRIAIGQLVDAGKLALGDKIEKHLPDYPNSEVATKVTLQHLLDHSSGIGDIFNPTYFRSSKTSYREPADFFPVFADEPLQFEPGSQSSYSNGGFMVLGAIIAAVSGQSYADYVAEHIFQPAGMSSTGFFARDEVVPNVAVGYTRMGPQGTTEELRNNLYRLPVRGNSAGSAFSTVDDMLAFDNALREHRLLPPGWTRWQFGGPTPAEQTEPASSERSRASIGIAGGAPGVSSVMESDGGMTLVVLSNHDEPGAERIARQLRRPLARALASAGS